MNKSQSLALVCNRSDSSIISHILAVADPQDAMAGKKHKRHHHNNGGGTPEEQPQETLAAEGGASVEWRAAH